jgi:hypothetical protein
MDSLPRCGTARIIEDPTVSTAPPIKAASSVHTGTSLRNVEGIGELSAVESYVSDIRGVYLRNAHR